MAKTVLITVGTTQFEELIKHTDSSKFVNFMTALGFSNIIYQIGNTGNYIPKSSQYFRVSTEIHNYYKAADLIITHGGAGTLLQNLLEGKMMIAVVNDTLMNNHQEQLVSKLNAEGYVLGFSSAKQMMESFGKIQNFVKNGEMKKYERPKECLMNRLVFGK